ncbi:MAG TPA: carboxypeptidase M32, partial [Gemmataceae bacterium]|nr:carboxypeptidase M32 [Gemmataceae bacterium]
AAQLMEQARVDLPELDSGVRSGDFRALKSWLNEKIHKHGQRWRAGELCRRITGRPLTPGPLMNYLRRKYTQLYGL